MITNLIELLEKTEIAHPTRVEWLRFCGSDGLMLVSGFPWWEGKVWGEPAADAKIAFRFQGIFDASITDSWLREDEFEDDLEEFSVSPLSAELWHSAQYLQVFASAPLPNPLTVIVAMERALSKLSCPVKLERFLAAEDGISVFVDRSAAAVSLVCLAPKQVCEDVANALKAQGVPFTTVSGGAEPQDGYLLRWWDGYLLCETAEAIWGDDLTSLLAANG